MSKRFLKSFLSVIMIALIAVTAFTACSDNADGSSIPSSVSENLSAFTLEVTNENGEITEFTVDASKETVGEALLEAGIIEGTESEYGLYITTVNGITADYDADGAYWAFLIDGEYASQGVDSTNIDTSKIYSLVYTKE